MNDYEEKVLNIMDSAKDNIAIQIDRAYHQGYAEAKSEKGQNVIDLAHKEIDRAYQRGLNEAWEAAKKIHDGQIPYEVFGLDKTGNGFTYASPLNWGEVITAQEAIAKIKEYEDKQKQDTVQVGDEIVLNGNASHENEKAIILAYDGKSYPYNVLMSNGDSEWIKEDAIECKTGRHFDQIAEVLEKMRGEKE